MDLTNIKHPNREITCTTWITHLRKTEQRLTWYLSTLQDAGLETWRWNWFRRTIVDSTSYELKKPIANSSKRLPSQFEDIKTIPIWQDGWSQAIEKPRKELLVMTQRYHNATMGRVLPMTKYFNVLCCSQHNHTKFQYTSIMSSWYPGNNVTIKYPKLHLRTFSPKGNAVNKDHHNFQENLYCATIHYYFSFEGSILLYKDAATEYLIILRPCLSEQPMQRVMHNLWYWYTGISNWEQLQRSIFSWSLLVQMIAGITQAWMFNCGFNGKARLSIFNKSKSVNAAWGNILLSSCCPIVF